MVVEYGTGTGYGVVVGYGTGVMRYGCGVRHGGIYARGIWYTWYV